MTEYHAHGVHLSKAQHTKVQGALHKRIPVTLRLKHSHLKGPHMLHLTKMQLKKLAKRHTAGSGADLTLSHKQLVHSYKHGSGIFGSILKAVAAPVINAGANYLTNKITGNGFLDDLKDTAKSIAKTVAKKGVEYGANYVTNKINGAGRKRKGDGLVLPGVY